MGKSKDLPRGVILNGDSKISPYIARYTNGDIKRSKHCKSLEDAVAKRKSWEEKYGKPKSKILDKEDLSGKRFGKLNVIKYAGFKNGRAMWECKCDCGNVLEVRGDSLISGNTKSCGCSSNEFRMPHLTVDLKGKRFGKLTAIKRLDMQDKEGNFYWECRCDCGNITKATTRDLNNGDVIRCKDCRKEYFEKIGIEKMHSALEDVQIDGVQILRFNDKTNKNNKSGFKGVMLDKRNNRYYAQLTVKGKVYTKSGFDTAEDAYYNGRLVLEDKYLPPKEEIEKLRKEVKGKKKED